MTKATLGNSRHKYLTLLIYYLVYEDKKLSVYPYTAHNYYFAVSEHTDARFAQIKATYMHAFWHQLALFRKFIAAVLCCPQIPECELEYRGFLLTNQSCLILKLM